MATMKFVGILALSTALFVLILALALFIFSQELGLAGALAIFAVFVGVVGFIIHLIRKLKEEMDWTNLK